MVTWPPALQKRGTGSIWSVLERRTSNIVKWKKHTAGQYEYDPYFCEVSDPQLYKCTCTHTHTQTQSHVCVYTHMHMHI